VKLKFISTDQALFFTTQTKKKNLSATKKNLKKRFENTFQKHFIMKFSN
jgi:hypothetical protein